MRDPHIQFHKPRCMAANPRPINSRERMDSVFLDPYRVSEIPGWGKFDDRLANQLTTFGALEKVAAY
jgi:hypothetical protein